MPVHAKKAEGPMKWRSSNKKLLLRGESNFGGLLGFTRLEFLWGKKESHQIVQVDSTKKWGAYNKKNRSQRGKILFLFLTELDLETREAQQEVELDPSTPMDGEQNGRATNKSEARWQQ